jgi:AdoMet-dependent heme synthase
MSEAGDASRKQPETDSFFAPDKLNFNERPLVVIWEVTQACDLACFHCRACAQPLRDLRELTTVEGKRLINEVAEMGSPIFVLTGGDPLKRRDIYDLVEYAAQRGVRPSLTPSATPLLTREALVELKRRGLARLALSLDASTPELHDTFRGVHGSWARTLEAVCWAREAGLPVQINTTVTARNRHDLENVATLLEQQDVVLWSVFFLVPTGRGQKEDLITAAEAEQIFETLHSISQRVRFHIKTTEGQHYRRFLLQKQAKARARTSDDSTPARGRVPSRVGVNDGKGFVFISHLGDVFPSGFMPLFAGNVREAPLAEIYRDSPLMQALRDPDCLKGKCCLCEYRNICGGSRARAFSVTGDPFAPDPLCAYQPPAMHSSA